ncbi:MAG: hypothetical protein UT94_C0024G0007 [Candidatus Uhrbacteria bacterium GW2011_GWF2_40_263]|nr:MAG: hypothetical protein UT94_C0024G0007 [Candidatus Uhrbacteria bacterium GW2011_GWF2_40_263]
MNTEYELNNVTIDKIYKDYKDINGNPLLSKEKKLPYVKVNLDFNPRTINDPDFRGRVTYFDYFDNTNGWVDGMSMTGKIVVKESNGRKYFNLELPPKEGGRKALELDFKEFDNRLKVVEEKLGIVTPRKELWNGVAKTVEVKDALDFSKKALEPAKTLTQEEELEDELPF